MQLLSISKLIIINLVVHLGNYSTIYILNILLASRSCTPLLFSYPLRGILRKSKNINCIFSIFSNILYIPRSG